MNVDPVKLPMNRPLIQHFRWCQESFLECPAHRLSISGNFP